MIKSKCWYLLIETLQNSSANLVGSKIVYFGGGGRYHTNEVYVLDLIPSKEALNGAYLLTNSENSDGCSLRSECVEGLEASETDSKMVMPDSAGHEPRTLNFLLSRPVIYYSQRSPAGNDTTTAATTSSSSSSSHSGETKEVVEGPEGFYTLTRFPPPAARACAISLHVGRFILYFGGWSHSRSELSCLWVHILLWIIIVK